MCFKSTIYTSTQLNGAVLLRCIKREKLCSFPKIFFLQRFISPVFYTWTLPLQLFWILQFLHCLKCLCWNGLWDRQEASALCMHSCYSSTRDWSLSMLQWLLWALAGYLLKAASPALLLPLVTSPWPNNLLRRGIFLKQWITSGSNNTQFLLLLNTTHYKKGQFFYHDHLTGGKLRHRTGIHPEPLAHFVC